MVMTDDELVLPVPIVPVSNEAQSNPAPETFKYQCATLCRRETLRGFQHSAATLHRFEPQL
jgi:hypothetical protein